MSAIRSPEAGSTGDPGHDERGRTLTSASRSPGVARASPSIGAVAASTVIQRLLTSVVIGVALPWAVLAAPLDTSPPLVFEATVALPNTSGRIDHLDIDLKRERLFVAELGNGSVDVVDLKKREVVHRISGLNEPQGVAYVPKSDLLAVTGGGDGTVRIFSASDFSSRAVVKLGDDADNIRLDPRGDDIVVGYGSGGLAILDPVKAVKLTDIPLPAHPEGFQISASDGRAYLNVPGAHQVDIADLNSGKLIARWTAPRLSANFPMALGDGSTVAVAFRSPARMVRFDLATGRPATISDTCGDADDVYFDARRQRYYVSCGAGAIDVFQLADGAVAPVGSVSIPPGARTSLFVPEMDRLFVAVRAGLLGSNASIQIFRPAPGKP